MVFKDDPKSRSQKDKVYTFQCDVCGFGTPHTEDPVPDKESATVFHCLYCGNEKRPKGGNAMVLA